MEWDTLCGQMTLGPYNVTNSCHYVSNNTSVTTVNTTGRVSYVGVGATTVTMSMDYYRSDAISAEDCGMFPATFAEDCQVTTATVKIKRGGTDITGTLQNVIVGQEINLTTEVEPAGATLTNRQWTVPGIRVANYVANVNTGTVTSLSGSGLTGTSVVFYWVDGGDGRQVQYSVKVNGMTLTAAATFNVKRPTAQVTTTTGNVSIANRSGSLWLQFGDLPNPGIMFSRTVMMPSGFLGDLQWVQVANPNRTRKLTSNGTTQTFSGAGLDTFYPYPDTTVSTTTDSPDTELTSDYTQKTVSDSFEMWLMFQPIGVGNAIWVPLRKVSWSWAGATTRSGATWILNSSSHSQNPTDADSTTHPTWIRNVTSDTWH